jgi:Cephalosporin hydroxylase
VDSGFETRNRRLIGRMISDRSLRSAVDWITQSAPYEYCHRFKWLGPPIIGGTGRIVGVDIDIRPPNRRAIETHPLGRRITLTEGSSTDERTAHRVYALARSRERV